jgi:hypothetical protein
MHTKFRPQNLPLKWCISYRRRTGQNPGDDHYQESTDFHLKKYGWLWHYFGILHYHADHAPDQVTKRWKQASLRWKAKTIVKAGTDYERKYTFMEKL